MLRRWDIRAAFFDVDGTLVNSRADGIPEDTRRALDALRARGVKICLSTGRHINELLCVADYRFDASVVLNGQLCYDDGGFYVKNPIDPAEIRALVEQVQAADYCCAFVDETRTFINRVDDRVRAVTSLVTLPTPPVEPIERALETDIYQLNPYLTEEEECLPMSVLPGCMLKRWHPLYFDVLARTGGKGMGVRRTLERFGLAPGQAIAFGDSENDLDMFDVVGLSVAMGNGSDEAKARADYVTGTNDGGGIADALRHFHLI